MYRLLVLPFALLLLASCSGSKSSTQTKIGGIEHESSDCSKEKDVNLCVGDKIGFYGESRPGGDSHAAPDLSHPMTVTEIISPGELTQEEKAILETVDPSQRAQTESALRSTSKMLGTRVFTDRPKKSGAFPYYYSIELSWMFHLKGCWDSAGTCVGDKSFFWSSGYTHQEIVGVAVIKSTWHNGELLVRWQYASQPATYTWVRSLETTLGGEGCMTIPHVARPFCIGESYLFSDQSVSQSGVRRGTLRYFTKERLFFADEKGELYEPIFSQSGMIYFIEQGCVAGLAGNCFPEVATKSFYFAASRLMNAVVQYKLSVIGNWIPNDSISARPTLVRDESGGVMTLTEDASGWLYSLEGCLSDGKTCIGSTIYDHHLDEVRHVDVTVVGINKAHDWVVGSYNDHYSPSAVLIQFPVN